MSAGGSVKVVAIALMSNLGIAAAKFAGAYISGSASMLAEAIHSVVDCANQALLLIGGKAARKPATESHPLGYGREAFFWSFLVAIFLFSMGGLFAIYEGLHKLHSHEPPGSPGLGLAILVLSLLLEGYSYRACLKEIRERSHFKGLWEWFQKASEADLLVIFMEDTAAIVGLATATVALLLCWWTGSAFWDAAGSIAVGLVLVGVSFLLAVEIKSLIIGEAPARDYRSEVGRIVTEEIPKARVLRFIALHTGAHEVMVAYKVTPGEVAQVSRLVDALNRVEARVKERFPEIRWQFIEPDSEA